MLFSIIIPVYNRPNEVRELLDSLSKQNRKNFEIVIVDDGSEESSEPVVKEFNDRLDIKYYWKENTGAGLTRNYGAKRAEGEWLLFFDSDCIIPPDYFDKVEEFLEENPDVDFYGGPDRATKDFNVLQRAISYSMTSFFTTGGIRNREKNLSKYEPRSFNLGVKYDAYFDIGGFPKTRLGEDIIFSLRLYDAGYRARMIKDAFVYHKRRTNLKAFFKQVINFGVGRINITTYFPDSLKMVHALPSCFTVYSVGSVLIAPYTTWPLGLLLLWMAFIFSDSLIKNKKLSVAGLSIVTSFTQLFAYGLGFILGVLGRRSRI